MLTCKVQEHKCNSNLKKIKISDKKLECLMQCKGELHVELQVFNGTSSHFVGFATRRCYCQKLASYPSPTWHSPRVKFRAPARAWGHRLHPYMRYLKSCCHCSPFEWGCQVGIPLHTEPRALQ